MVVAAAGRRLFEISPEFVETIPNSLEPGKLYLSCKYQAALHLCACGCGSEISTPLHPTGWRLTFDGESVSLRPSVGNWSEKCQSHYVIQNNRVIWGRRLPRYRVEQIRESRHDDIAKHYRLKQPMESPAPPISANEARDVLAKLRWIWTRLYGTMIRLLPCYRYR